MKIVRINEDLNTVMAMAKACAKNIKGQIS